MVWDSAYQSLQKHARDLTTPLVLAVSGGVDSMVLMHVVKNAGYTQVYVVYFDHGLRRDTDKDWQIVSDAAAAYGYLHEKIDISQELGQRIVQGHNTENSARKLRYQHLERVRQQQRALWILTGHHQNDVLESQLMHFGRGAGLMGLVGIREVDRKRAYLRIFLTTAKEDIVQYAKQHQLTWHEDTTNTENSYTRNHIRQGLIPAFTQIYPALLSSAQHLSEYVQEALDYHTELLTQSLGDIESIKGFSIETYKNLPPVLQKHALILLARSLDISYTAGHIEALRKNLCENFASGKVLYLSPECTLERSFDRILIHRPGSQEVQQTSQKAGTHEVNVPEELAGAQLRRVPLKNAMRIRQYRLSKNPQGVKQVSLWHTTFKKWRLKHKISWQEAKTLYGAEDSETGEIVAVFHELWHYPDSISTVRIPCL